MDSIIGLLFLILPVLFSLIGKKLEKASEDGEQTPSMPEAFPRMRRELPQEEAVSALPKQQVSEAAPGKVAKPYKVIEEEKSRRKEPVDPKKLVVYSEIMKPKYLE